MKKKSKGIYSGESILNVTVVERGEADAVTGGGGGGGGGGDSDDGGSTRRMIRVTREVEQTRDMRVIEGEGK